MSPSLSFSQTFPPGNYFIGDISFVLDADGFLKYWKDSSSVARTVHFRKGSICVGRTFIKDFPELQGKEGGSVDFNVFLPMNCHRKRNNLGIVSSELIKGDTKNLFVRAFEEPVVFSCDSDGVFEISSSSYKLVISTDGQDDLD